MTPTEERLKKIKTVAAHRNPDLVLVLEDLNDPHNAAAIMRSADSMGIQKLYLIFEEQTPWDPTQIGKHSSAHTNKWLDFEIFDSRKACLSKLKQAGFEIWATHLHARATKLDETDFTQSKRIALIIGNENRGISEAMKNAADQLIYIPMKGFCESLNVSVATALCVWEITRQWGRDKNRPAPDLKLMQNIIESLVKKS